MNDRHDPTPTAVPRVRALASRARLGAALAGAIVVSTACHVLPVTNGAPRYVEPLASAGSAKVRVVNTHPFAYYADIAVFDSPTCFAKANLGMTGGNSRDAERIGMLDDKPVSASTLERTVLAGEALVIGPRAVFPTVTTDEIMHSMMPHTLDEVRARQAGVCKMSSFVPQAGEQYEVVVDLAPARCTVTPFRLVGDKGAVTREPVETTRSQISTYEFDMKCFK